MSIKLDSLKINDEKLDKRVKISAEIKEDIRNLYATGLHSYNSLAKLYNVSKKTIYYIIKPENYEIAKEKSKERRKDGRYYNREKHTEYVRKHRRYKNELHNDGKI
jgi:transposase-like protein